MTVHRIDLKWSLWSVNEETWEERGASKALAAMKAAAAGGDPVTVHTTPGKEIRYGTVTIGRRPDHFMAEHARFLPQLTAAYDRLSEEQRAEAEALEAAFFDGDRAGFIAWAQEQVPEAFTTPEPPAPTNVAYVHFCALWDDPADLVPDSVSEERREEVEDQIRSWLANGAGFDESGDAVGAQIDAEVEAGDFAELLRDIDEIENALLEREAANSKALDEFLTTLGAAT